MKGTALTLSMTAKLCAFRSYSCLLQKDLSRLQSRPAGLKTRKLLLNLFLAATCSQFVQGQGKLAIESPVNGQKFTVRHAVVVARIDPSVTRVIATVTAPVDKKLTPEKSGKSNAGGPGTEDRAAPAPRTIFTAGPVTLPRGADRWSTDVSLAEGENSITVSDADHSETKHVIIVIAEDSNTAADDRNSFEASFYAGASIDSFASNGTKQYIGYTASDSGQKTGYTAGVNFEFRLFRRKTESRWPVQLWLFGETVHGQRSAEVDCSQGKSSPGNAAPVCDGFKPESAANSFLAILRNSSSLESFAGARLEFLKLNRSSNHSANLFVKTNLGFVTVQDNGGDFVDDHLKVAVGTILTNGPFRGSYMDVGWGRTDLFAVHPGRRFKVDGYVQWNVNTGERFSFSPYFQIVVDSDFGRGADDVRSYYGINMEIRNLGCIFKPENCANKATDKTSDSAATKAKAKK